MKAVKAKKTKTQVARVRAREGLRKGASQSGAPYGVLCAQVPTSSEVVSSGWEVEKTTSEIVVRRWEKNV